MPEESKAEQKRELPEIMKDGNAVQNQAREVEKLLEGLGRYWNQDATVALIMRLVKALYGEDERAVWLKARLQEHSCAANSSAFAKYAAKNWGFRAPPARGAVSVDDLS